MSAKSKTRVYIEQSRSAPKKFYIKTFGCQMNKNCNVLDKNQKMSKIYVV